MFIKLMEIVFHTFCHLSTINTVTSSFQHQTSALQRITRRTPPQLINTCLRVQNTSTHNYTTKKKLSPLQNKKNAQRLWKQSASCTCVTTCNDTLQDYGRFQIINYNDHNWLCLTNCNKNITGRLVKHGWCKIWLISRIYPL